MNQTLKYRKNSLKISKGAISSCESKKDRRKDKQWPMKKENKDLQNIIHRKVKLEPHEPYQKPGMNSGTPEGQVFPTLHVASVAVYDYGDGWDLSSQMWVSVLIMHICIC